MPAETQIKSTVFSAA